jgi:hypothetical protein
VFFKLETQNFVIVTALNEHKHPKVWPQPPLLVSNTGICKERPKPGMGNIGNLFI